MEGDMNVKEVLEKLKEYDILQKLSRSLVNPHSYRGDYSEIGFVEHIESTTVGEMITTISGVIGTTYTGWKGGNFTMSEYSNCYIAEKGSCGRELTEDFIELIVLEEICE